MACFIHVLSFLFHRVLPRPPGPLEFRVAFAGQQLFLILQLFLVHILYAPRLGFFTWDSRMHRVRIVFRLSRSWRLRSALHTQAKFVFPITFSLSVCNR